MDLCQTVNNQLYMDSIFSPLGTPPFINRVFGIDESLTQDIFVLIAEEFPFSVSVGIGNVTKYESFYPSGSTIFLETVDSLGFGGNVTIDVNRADCDLDAEIEGNILKMAGLTPIQLIFLVKTSRYTFVDPKDAIDRKLTSILYNKYNSAIPVKNVRYIGDVQLSDVNEQIYILPQMETEDSVEPRKTQFISHIEPRKSDSEARSQNTSDTSSIIRLVRLGSQFSNSFVIEEFNCLSYTV